MASILNEIGAFQFDNLVNNRIPFLLVNLGADLTGLYMSHLQAHLERQAFTTTPSNVLTDLAAKKIPKEFAIIVLCQDGDTSAKTVDALESAGYTNVFFLKNGFKNFLADRNS
jgi:rhodanese-related sulfurtransferase